MQRIKKERSSIFSFIPQLGSRPKDSLAKARGPKPHVISHVDAGAQLLGPSPSVLEGS